MMAAPFVNYCAAVASNQAAEEVLAEQPVQAYIVWRVPFEHNLFRISYVSEEGPPAATRRVVRSLDVSYLSENGSYVIDQQLHQTMYPTLFQLVQERMYINHALAVPGAADRPEPERTALQLSMTEQPTGPRRRAAPTARPHVPDRVKKPSLANRTLACLRKCTPSRVDKLVWLWDRLPHKLLMGVGLLVVLLQLATLVWAWSIRTGVRAEKERLERMSFDGIKYLTDEFNRVLAHECVGYDGVWGARLTALHDALEEEFNGSPAATAVFRVTVAYLLGLACMAVLSWIGFPASQAVYEEELAAHSTSISAQRTADAMNAGPVPAAVRHTRPKLAPTPAPTTLAGKLTSPPVLWGVLCALSLLAAVGSIALGYVYFSVPEHVSQHFEDMFVAMHPATFTHLPECKAMTARALEVYWHSPHILTLRIREEVPGGGCLFGGHPVPLLSQWQADLHGDLPLFHCNSVIMPSTVGFVRLVLLAVAGVVVVNALVLFVRDLLCDITMVGRKVKKY